MKLYDINQHLNDQKHEPNSLVENSPLGKEWQKWRPQNFYNKPYPLIVKTPFINSK